MSSSRRAANVSQGSGRSIDYSPAQSAAAADTYVQRGIQELHLDNENGSAQETLQRWLSLRSVISNASSYAIQQEEAALNSSQQVFRSIGQGFCAEVFNQVGKGLVIKRAFTPQNMELWNDFRQHVAIHEAISHAFSKEVDLDVYVPMPLKYLTRDDTEWWDQNRAKWPTSALREPTDLLESERIMPLPQIIRQSLIHLFCLPHLRSAAIADRNNRDCLVRVYLGVRRPNRLFSSNFSLRNFEADLSVIDQLTLEKAQHARAMAICLAEMHWKVHVDAGDVEFVLGTAPEKFAVKAVEIKNLPPRSSTAAPLSFKRRLVHLWLLDFNQCRAITLDDRGVTQAVNAYWQNDPYYPRPCPPGHSDEALWNLFSMVYIEHSDQIGTDVNVSSLARLFIDGVVSEAIRRFKATSGPSGPPSGPPPGPPRGGSSSSGPSGHGRSSGSSGGGQPQGGAQKGKGISRSSGPAQSGSFNIDDLL